MNKEEIIKKLTKAKACTNPHSLYGRCVKSEHEFKTGFDDGIDFALGIINELDKAEKPVLSEAEDEWLKQLKIAYPFRPDQLHIIARQGWGYDFEYTVGNIEYKLSYEPYKSKEGTDYVKIRLIKAIMYGYTVQKEKLYTAKLKSSDEYLYYDKDYKEIRHTKVPDNVVHEIKGYLFTEDDLVKYHAWENTAYQVNEVKYE